MIAAIQAEAVADLPGLKITVERSACFETGSVGDGHGEVGGGCGVDLKAGNAAQLVPVLGQAGADRQRQAHKLDAVESDGGGVDGAGREDLGVLDGGVVV